MGQLFKITTHQTVIKESEIKVYNFSSKGGRTYIFSCNIILDIYLEREFGLATFGLNQRRDFCMKRQTMTAAFICQVQGYIFSKDFFPE